MLPIDPNDKLIIVNVARSSTVVDPSLGGERLLKPDGRVISRGQVPDHVVQQIQQGVLSGHRYGDFNVGPVTIVWEVF